MEKIIEFKNVNFKYPTSEKYALKGIELSINEGDFVVVCGKSGCGKTTLLRQIKKSLMPHGEPEGSVYFCGQAVQEMDLREESSQIGFVMQNPDNQIVTDKVWHELAFGLENLGLENRVIRRKTAEMSAFFGIDGWFNKSVSDLSGGQKQLLNLASIMVMEPKLLILDEPTAQLDPIAAENFLSVVGRINKELGTTVIITEHRLQEILPMADSVVIMENGSIVTQGNAKECGRWLKDNKNGMFAAMPAPMRVYAAVENNKECPVTVGEGRVWLKEIINERKVYEIEHTSDKTDNEYAVELKDIWFRYGRTLPDVIKGLNLKIHKGEIYAILGGNGVGKSTAMSVLCGINKPYRGKIKIQGHKNLPVPIRSLPQNPQTLFVKNTVREELSEVSKNNRDTKNIVSLCELDGLLDRHPYDLSGGEQQRTALAKVLLTKPRILILDEPTKGLDAEFKMTFSAILNQLKKNGMTIIMVSHDVEFCIECADRCGMFFDGAIAAEGQTHEFFSNNSFYNTSAARMAKNIIDNAVSVDDIIYALTGTKEEHAGIGDIKIDLKSDDAQDDGDTKKKRFAFMKNDKFKVSKAERKNNKNLLPILIIFFLVPLTILFGMYVLGDRKYYIISMLIIAETMIPFFALFEWKKPRAREIVIISVLCAIAVASRTMFFMVPQVKPIMAVVIISGIAFGGETGFLVGAVSAFVSNFFFGQGPWTVWQMFSMGLGGFTAGVVFNKLPCRRISIAVVGAIITFVLYGGIMNLSSLLMYQQTITKEMIFTTYAMGIPFDAIHAVGVFVFLYIISKPMLGKLERIKVKYGLVKVK